MANASVLPLLEAEGQDAGPYCPSLAEGPMTAVEAETAARMFRR